MKKHWHFIHQYLSKQLVKLIQLIITLLINVIIQLSIPLIIANTIDQLIKAQFDISQIMPNILILASLTLIGMVSQYLYTKLSYQLSNRLSYDLRYELFKQLSIIKLSVIDTLAIGDILNSMINDIEFIKDGLFLFFSQFINGVLTLVGILIIMFSINTTMALLVIILTPISLFIARFINQRSFKLFKSQSLIRGQLSGYINEIIHQQKTIQLLNAEEQSFEYFRSINESLHQVGVKAQFYSSLINPSTRLINGMIYVTLGLVGGLNVINHMITIGQLTAFLQYTNNYAKPFNEISSVINELQIAFASLLNIQSLMASPIDQPDDALDTFIYQDGEVTFDQVEFAYQKDQSFIKNLSFDVKSGKHFAIVGPTGCGKTTLINLLMRFYELDSGTIKISHQDISKVKRHSFRQHIGMVLQDSWIFEGTIRDNIAYGHPSASDEAIKNTAKRAYADDFINQLPYGYSTQLVADGENLSQGQQQLISIARVMLMNPDILILDEATSNIDTLTEIRVQEAFKALMENRTSFVIAHRLSTIQAADCILVMKDGKIIEYGTHNELLNKQGYYNQLFHSQFEGNE